MSFSSKLKQIGRELKVHSPFTLIGAATGIVFMLIGRKFLAGHEGTLFSIFHPLHVVLSAMVTAALFEIHRRAKSFLLILIVGIVGSIGIATLSDCIVPFFGESILGVAVPKHSDLHAHDHDEETLINDLQTDHDAGCTNPDHDHAAETAAIEDTHEHHEGCDHAKELAAAAVKDNHEHHEGCDHETAATADVHEHGEGCGHPLLHIGFIEEWYLVFPAAIFGVLLAYFFPYTKYPHAAHVLFSTWASSAHIMMNTHADITALLLVGIFLVLFLAVWLPCCVSDIIFPLLFVRSDGAHVGHSCCMLCGKKDPKPQEEKKE
ncbi:MAG: hypothetical protein ACYSUT_05075 [Planctomycetota bacterium]|jgi:hypothetical protein